jgi:Domain of unknown function (DUF4136)
MDCRKATRLLALIALLISSAIALAQKVETTVDHAYDLSKATTYALAPLSKNSPLNKTPEVEYQVRTELTKELEKLGLKEDKEHPDLLVTYSADEKEFRNSYSTAQTGVTAGNQSWSEDYINRTLSLTFFDTKTNKSVWQSITTERTNPGPMEDFIPKLMKKTIEVFAKDSHRKLGKG